MKLNNKYLIKAQIYKKTFKFNQIMMMIMKKKTQNAKNTKIANNAYKIINANIAKHSVNAKTK